MYFSTRNKDLALLLNKCMLYLPRHEKNFRLRDSFQFGRLLPPPAQERHRPRHGHHDLGPEGHRLLPPQELSPALECVSGHLALKTRISQVKEIVLWRMWQKVRFVIRSFIRLSGCNCNMCLESRSELSGNTYKIRQEVIPSQSTKQQFFQY